MKYKIIMTIILFIFSVIYIKNGVYLLRENDNLMKIIKEKQTEYNIESTDAIITEHTMIPGINGRKINIKKSYNNMKGVNEFKESLLIYDEIKPNKTIDNKYNKVIISGNPQINKISILTDLDNRFCYIEDLNIKKECIQNNMYTILIHKINNNYLTKVKETVTNGIIYYLNSINQDDLNLVIKYLRNNNYEIIDINELIKIN